MYPPIVENRPEGVRPRAFHVPRRLVAAALLLGLAGGALPALAVSLNPYEGITSVEVFANSAMLVTPTRASEYRLVIHRMDQLEQVKRALSQRIPKGGQQVAYKWVMDNQAQIKRQIQPAAVAAANAINLANYYRIDRLPAIVINRKSVIYGVTDVDQALQLYQARAQRGRR